MLQRLCVHDGEVRPEVVVRRDDREIAVCRDRQTGAGQRGGERRNIHVADTSHRDGRR